MGQKTRCLWDYFSKSGGFQVASVIHKFALSSLKKPSCVFRCKMAFYGGAGNRTAPESPAFSATLKPGGAESDALARTDPELGTIFDAWPTLPAAMRAGILAMIRTVQP